MSKVQSSVVNKALDIARESMSECQWIVGNVEAALNLMYRGLNDKNDNDETIAAIGMLREYFQGGRSKVLAICDRFEQQLLQEG